MQELRGNRPNSRSEVDTGDELVSQAMPDLRWGGQNAQSHEAVDSVCKVRRMGHRTAADAWTRLPRMQRAGHALVVQDTEFGTAIYVKEVIHMAKVEKNVLFWSPSD